VRGDSAVRERPGRVADRARGLGRLGAPGEGSRPCSGGSADRVDPPMVVVSRGGVVRGTSRQAP